MLLNHRNLLMTTPVLHSNVTAEPCIAASLNGTRTSADVTPIHTVDLETNEADYCGYTYNDPASSGLEPRLADYRS